MKVFVGFILVIGCAATSLAQTFDFRFTNPLCAKYGDKPQNAFCTRDDLAKAQSNPEGPFQKVIELIKSKANKKITLGTMTFSHKLVATELCKAIQSGVEVEIILDVGSEMLVTDQVAACGAKVYKIGTDEGEDQRGDLHHNKFLLLEQRENSHLVFATANFSNPGMTINHETWSFVEDKNDSSIIKSHKCLIEALKKYTDNLTAFRTDLNKCRAHFTNEAAEQIESFFVPADSAKLLKLIEEKIQTSNRVLLTSNRYSYDKITALLSRSRSRDSRAIFDDDLFWGGIQPTPDYVNEALDAKKVVKLESVGVNVRFTQTSFGAAQKMHDKFIVFDDLVIVGAGNYTYAGMTSNFENFYVIRNMKAVDLFKKQFEYLWNISTERRQMPNKYWDPGVRP